MLSTSLCGNQKDNKLTKIKERRLEEKDDEPKTDKE